MTEFDKISDLNKSKQRKITFIKHLMETLSGGRSDRMQKAVSRITWKGLLSRIGDELGTPTSKDGSIRSKVIKALLKQASPRAENDFLIEKILRVT